MTDSTHALGVVQLGPSHERALAEFFRALVGNGDDKTFHPHPFDVDTAARICRTAGRDLYCGAVHGDEVLAYGMLRGWDAGFEVPSLGVAVHPAYRGLLIGSLMVQFLHVAARLRNSKRIRLKVYRTNRRALDLYRKLGYAFESEQGDEMIGILTF